MEALANAATTFSALEEKHANVTSDSDASVSSSSNVRSSGKQRVSSARKRVIDETQLSPEEAEKLQSRRAYNRECATRARKRTKTLVSQLQDEVKELQRDKDDLRRENAVMKAQLEGLEKQNHTLLFKQAVDRQSMNVFSHGAGFMQPGMNLGDALTGLRMANLRTDAASRAGLLHNM